MNYVLLTSSARIKKLTGVYENFYDEIISPFVLQAQDIYVQEKLGTTFFNNLKGRVSGNTITSLERVLLNDYIAPMLANYSVYLALPSIHYRIKNKSVLVGTSEEAQTASLQELNFLRSSILDVAQFYGERMREYLRANENSFPDYILYDVDFMKPNKLNTYSQGLYIPKSYGCGLYGDDIKSSL
jgi:hypothetical protein